MDDDDFKWVANEKRSVIINTAPWKCSFYSPASPPPQGVGN